MGVAPTTHDWGELRCPDCIKSGRYSKILVRYVVGSISGGGRLEVLCKCGKSNGLTHENQYFDGVSTFRSGSGAHRIAS